MIAELIWTALQSFRHVSRVFSLLIARFRQCVSCVAFFVALNTDGLFFFFSIVTFTWWFFALTVGNHEISDVFPKILESQGYALCRISWQWVSFVVLPKLQEFYLLLHSFS